LDALSWRPLDLHGEAKEDDLDQDYEAKANGAVVEQRRFGYPVAVEVGWGCCWGMRLGDEVLSEEHLLFVFGWWIFYGGVHVGAAFL
jgi:hypothetical protein